jgi:hypothetical protein
MPQLITPWDILTSSGKYLDRIDSPECVTGVRINAADLAERVSKLLGALGYTTAKVSSGFRTQAANSAANGAKLSAHQTGEAVDLEDIGNTLCATINRDPSVLDTFDLYMENSFYTKGWCHLQLRPTKSGRRIFTP